jgi:hypothetical protein
MNRRVFGERANRESLSRRALAGFLSGSDDCYSHLWRTLWIRSLDAAKPFRTWLGGPSGPHLRGDALAPFRAIPAGARSLENRESLAPHHVARQGRKLIHITRIEAVEMCIRKTRKPRRNKGFSSLRRATRRTPSNDFGRVSH